jgi:hypothetical protein
MYFDVFRCISMYVDVIRWISRDYCRVSRYHRHILEIRLGVCRCVTICHDVTRGFARWSPGMIGKAFKFFVLRAWCVVYVDVCRCMSMYVDVCRCMSMYVVSMYVDVCRCMSMYVDVCRCDKVEFAGLLVGVRGVSPNFRETSLGAYKKLSSRKMIIAK